VGKAAPVVEGDEEMGADERGVGLAHYTVCHCPGGARCLGRPDRECAGCGKPTRVVLAAGDHAMSLCTDCMAVVCDGRRADAAPLIYLGGGPPPTSEPTSSPVAAVSTREQVAQRLIDDLVQAALFLDEWDADEALPVRTVPRPSRSTRHQRPASATTSAAQADLITLPA
jgi:hypothetical protein